jgi:hypothetical protein
MSQCIKSKKTKEKLAGYKLWGVATEWGASERLIDTPPLRVLVGINFYENFNHRPVWSILDAFKFYGADYMLFGIVYHTLTGGQGHFTVDVRINEGLYYHHDGLKDCIGAFTFRPGGWTYLDHPRKADFVNTAYDTPAVAGLLYVRV